MPGRGEYYKQKYGGGRGGRGGGRGGRGGLDNHHQESFQESYVSQPSQSDTKPNTSSNAATQDSLVRLLRRIDGQSYNAYKDLYREQSWRFPQFSLHVTRVQSDAFAPPSCFRVYVPAADAKFPRDFSTSQIRRVALADYLHRNFHANCRSNRYDYKEASGGWSGSKGGDISVVQPCQHVMERTAVVVHPNGDVEARFTVGLPARGRTIMGEMASQVLTENVSHMVRETLLYGAYSNESKDEMKQHILSVEDQDSLRAKLKEKGLVAFVCNGATLPRMTGDSDKPLVEAGDDKVVTFQSPKDMEVSFDLPNRKVVGMGIPAGITILVGGGFHGKSTLLNALQIGIYNHIPGDGREFVVTENSAVKIRSEDGRSVQSVDISPFISNLPYGKDTKSFSTTNASGSTSQAANVMEYLEMGCMTLLIDEDTSATNFMMRDERMQMLVSDECEPITPFSYRVRELREAGVSCIIVIGGSGQYFGIADHVLMANSYRYTVVTDKAKDIAKMFEEREKLEPTKKKSKKTNLHWTDRKSKVRVSDERWVADRHGYLRSKDSPELDLSLVEQLVDIGQTKFIGNLFENKLMGKLNETTKNMKDMGEEMDKQMDEKGIDVFNHQQVGTL
ncbi:hypothetical protein PROFUN_12606, partial [Planoprotostelium fungivorum]